MQRLDQMGTYPGRQLSNTVARLKSSPSDKQAVLEHLQYSAHREELRFDDPNDRFDYRHPIKTYSLIDIISEIKNNTVVGDRYVRMLISAAQSKGQDLADYLVEDAKED